MIMDSVALGYRGFAGGLRLFAQDGKQPQVPAKSGVALHYSAGGGVPN
jgi:hypothetical protein